MSSRRPAGPVVLDLGDSPADWRRKLDALATELGDLQPVEVELTPWPAELRPVPSVEADDEARRLLVIYDRADDFRELAHRARQLCRLMRAQA